VDSGVAQRLRGDPDHMHLQYVRMGMCLAFCLGSALGLLRRLRDRRYWVLGGLAYVPFVLVALQGYGGEGILRVFLFAMPGLAIMTAGGLAELLAPRPLRAGLLVVALTVLAVWFTAVRGANEPFERITTGHLAAAKYLSRTARPGATITEYNSFGPYNSLWLGTDKDIAAWGLSTVADKPCATPSQPVTCVLALDPQWIYLTSSQAAYEELVDGLPPGWMPKMINDLVAGGNYRLVYRGRDAWVLGRLDLTRSFR